jgi:hypothetical protein
VTRLAALADLWHRLASALTGDAPHLCSDSYPGTPGGGCWCAGGRKGYSR